MQLPKQSNVLIIDAANLVFRAAYTFSGVKIKLKGTDISVSSGIIYQVISMLLGYYTRHRQTATFFVLEGSKANNPRYKMHEYKSKRPTSRTIDITAEMLLLKEIIVMLGGISVIPKRGEADDGIAYIAHHLDDKRLTKCIISNDHDMQALLGKYVMIVKNDATVTRESFIAKFGFLPKHYSLFSAIAGDSSDNIPGVRGFGKKKTLDIFTKLAKAHTPVTIDNVIKEIVSTKTGTHMKPADLLETIHRYYYLTHIRSDWPLTCYTYDSQRNHYSLTELLKELRMSALLRDIHRIKEMTQVHTKYQDSIIDTLQAPSKPATKDLLI